MPRTLSPYEKTHLHRFGKGNIDITKYGEMPVEYITGKVEFEGKVFEVNKNVLIPRIETEEFVTLAVETLTHKASEKPNHELVIADIGCGSGAIGITVYLQLQQKNIHPRLYLSDISAAALEMAKKNVENLIGENGEDAKVILLESDLLLSFPQDIKFDVIMANLPYIPSARVAVLDDSVKEYEPHLALDGGEDGLKYIKKLISQAHKRLNPGGKIILEVDYTHDEQFLRNNLELDEMELSTQRDQFERMRFVVVEKGE